MLRFTTQIFLKSRIATIDSSKIGKKKHHIAALLKIDLSASRMKFRKYKKLVVIDDKIEIGEILNMTVLLDHDVIDGAPMARFIKELSKNIENGIFL